MTSPKLSLKVPYMAYTKLFSSIVTSTIWTEDDRTRIVWITMLACADKNGELQASIPGLARIAGVPVEDCRVAIAKFLAPDPDSRTKDDEGRRIEEIDGGWSLLNFRKYREMASKEDTQASEAARKARYRAKIARNVPKCPTTVQGVSTVNPYIAETEAEAGTTVGAKPKASAPSPEHSAFIKGWCENFQAHFKVSYSFDGGRDGRAVKDLLKMGITALDLLEMAKTAWRSQSFPCKKARTVSGFRTNLNEIKAEIYGPQTTVGNFTGKPGASNPRNAGVCVGPTDYAAAFKRKASAMAGQVAPVGPETPPST